MEKQKTPTQVWGPFIEDENCPGQPACFYFSADHSLNVLVSSGATKIPARVSEYVHGASWLVSFTLPDSEGAVMVQVGSWRMSKQITVRADMSLWVWGTNPLLTGNFPMVPTCLRLPILSQISVESVAASENHLLILASSGQVFAGGVNNLGELGVGDILPRTTVEQVPLKSRASFVSARLNGSLIIDVLGNVLCAGIKIGAKEHATTFVVPEGMDVVRASSAAFVGDDVICLDANRSVVFQCGSFGRTKQPYRAFVAAKFPQNVKFVAANLLHQVVVTKESNLFVAEASFNPMPEMKGVPFDLGKVVDVKVSRCSAFFLLETGEVHELFLSPNRSDTQRYGPKKSVWTPIAVKNVLAIAPGSYHCLYLDRDGKVFGTGAASESQIGDQLDKGAVTFAYQPREVHVPKSFKIVSTQCFGAAILGLPKTHVGLYMSKLLKGDEYKDCTLKNDLGESLAVHRCILASRTQRQFWDSILPVMECGKVSLAAMQVFAELVYTQNFFCDDKNVMKEVGELAVKFHLKDSLVAVTRGEIMHSKDKGLENDLASMVGEQMFSDFSIECDDGPAIACHRVLLLKNPYFAALFSSSFAENTKGRVRLRDASRNGVFLLLRYVVCDDIIDELSPDDYVDVLLVCNALLLPDLKRTMETAIAKFLEPDNVGFLYSLALITGCDALASSCIQLGKSNLVAVMTAELDKQISDTALRNEFLGLIKGK